jgi:hypothetical protein
MTIIRIEPQALNFAGWVKMSGMEFGTSDKLATAYAASANVYSVQ